MGTITRVTARGHLFKAMPTFDPIVMIPIAPYMSTNQNAFSCAYHYQSTNQNSFSCAYHYQGIALLMSTEIMKPCSHAL